MYQCVKSCIFEKILLLHFGRIFRLFYLGKCHTTFRTSLAFLARYFWVHGTSIRFSVLVTFPTTCVSLVFDELQALKVNAIITVRIVTVFIFYDFSLTFLIPVS